MSEFKGLENFVKTGTKIICIGKSYNFCWPDRNASDALPEPLLFIKPISSYTSTGKVIEAPRGCTLVYEVELAVVIGKTGRSIPLKEASRYIGGYALALDMVASNVQRDAMKTGRPWATCKGLDTFCPIGKFIPKSSIKDDKDVLLDLNINGKTRQHDSTSGLIYTIPQLITYASGIFTLQPGDVILTGTPIGSGPCEVGDKLVAELSIPSSTDSKTAADADRNWVVLDRLEMDVVRRTDGFVSGSHWLDGQTED